jgi:hypothetical protein
MRDIGTMPSPEISTTRAIRWRAGIAVIRMREVVELLRAVADSPDYQGPPLEVAEKMADVLAEIHDQIARWHTATVKAHRVRVSLPRKLSSSRRAIASLYRN